jgi:DNA-directed RNA polymerase specialized sigma24 family protein
MKAPQLDGLSRAEPPFTGDASLAVGSTWPMFAPLLTRLAGRSAGDPDEAADLVQEALVHLWRMDPTRYDLRDRADYRYLRRALVNRMWRVWYVERDRLLTAAVRF